MSECKKCKYADDMKGCASTHAETALKLLAEGKIEEAQKNLESLQTHLKE
jgi:soluble cytochrome b562